MPVEVDGKAYQTMDEIEDNVFILRMGTFGYNRTKTAKSMGRVVKWARLKVHTLKKKGIVLPNNPNYPLPSKKKRMAQKTNSAAACAMRQAKKELALAKKELRVELKRKAACQEVEKFGVGL